MNKFENILKEPNLLDLSKKIYNAVLNEDFFTENKEINLSPNAWQCRLVWESKISIVK